MIKEWPVPKDKAAVKSFLQTVRFCSNYMRFDHSLTYSDVMRPLRYLTRQGVNYKWDKQCQDSFQKLKDVLVSDTVMASFDVARKTRLYVDHGPDGVASTVVQEYEIGKSGEKVYRPVHHSSRALTETEARYTKTDGESLAVLSGVKSNKMFLYGAPFEVIVDHKPLVSLYNSVSKPAPVRVDRHRSKLLAFDFKVKYEPGSSNPCDYGSRNPSITKKEYTHDECEELGIEHEAEDSEFSVNRLIEENVPLPITKEEIKTEMLADVLMRKLVEDASKGYLSKELAKSEYAGIFEEMSVVDGIILKGKQILIPPMLRRRVIELLHE